MRFRKTKHKCDDGIEYCAFKAHIKGNDTTQASAYPGDMIVFKVPAGHSAYIKFDIKLFGVEEIFIRDGRAGLIVKEPTADEICNGASPCIREYCGVIWKNDEPGNSMIIYGDKMTFVEPDPPKVRIPPGS